MPPAPPSSTTPRVFDLRAENRFGLIALSSDSGLEILLHPSGTLYAVRRDELILNQVLSSPLEGGMNRLYLRRWDRPSRPARRLAGPGARFSVQGRCARWEDEEDGLRVVTTLAVHPREPFWAWRVSLRADAPETARVDLLYGQDLGLADRGALRNNEAYVSQYLDHQAWPHPERGWMVASRQNQVQADGRHPWLLQGCRPGARAYSTDGFQFFGLTYKARSPPTRSWAFSNPRRRPWRPCRGGASGSWTG